MSYFSIDFNLHEKLKIRKFEIKLLSVGSHVKYLNVYILKFN